MKFTAVIFMAVFAAMKPSVYEKSPERVAVISVAAERAQEKLLPHWRRAPELLGGSIATAAIKESGLMEDTHSGERRGRAKEICLVQIHPTNRIWKRWAPSFESLAGVDLLSTERCLLSGGQTLVLSLNYCHKRRFYTNWAQAMWTKYHYGNRCWLSPHAHGRTALMNKIAWTKWEPTEEAQRMIDDVLAKENQ